MKKFEFDIVKFDNEDVIATSGFDREHANHFQVDGQFDNPTVLDFGGQYSYSGDLWEYYDNAWHKTYFSSGSVDAPDSDFFVDGEPTIGGWYYCDQEGSYLYTCPDSDHSYIQE